MKINQDPNPVNDIFAQIIGSVRSTFFLVCPDDFLIQNGKFEKICEAMCNKVRCHILSTMYKVRLQVENIEWMGGNQSKRVF